MMSDFGTLAAISICLIVAALIVGYSVRTGISPMPSSRSVRAAIVDLIPESGELTVVDLGSGWGTLLLAIALRRRNCRVVGYELSPIPFLISRIRCRIVGAQRLVVTRADFMNEPLDDADVVVCYLYPGAMDRLADKFRSQMKPGTMVISSTFAVPHWRPVATRTVSDWFGGTNIYVYRIPESLDSSDFSVIA